MKIDTLIKSIYKACYGYIHNYLYNKVSDLVEGYVNYNNAIQHGVMIRKDLISMLTKLGYVELDNKSDYEIEMMAINWIVNNLEILDLHYKYMKNRNRGLDTGIENRYKASKMLFVNDKVTIDTEDIRKIYKNATKYTNKICYGY